jgi:CCR4-NOT transcriptional complex subunit CAF120
MGGQPGFQGMQGMQGMQSGFPGMQGGVGSSMQGLNPVGMQHTGGSAFDARFSPGEGLKAPSPFQGQAAQGPSSRNSSPVGRGSPAPRSNDHSGLHPSSGRGSPRQPPQ